MGFFQGREFTTVGTSISRVIPDKILPDSAKSAIIKSLVSGGNVTDYVQDELANSLGIKAKRMYEYAEHTYAFGLPSGEFYLASQGVPEVKTILDAQTGTDTQPDYTHLGPMNTLHMGWMNLIRDYGYNSLTNELETLSAQLGKLCYLSNMTVIIPAATFDVLNPKAIEQWGVSPQAGYLPSNTPMIPGIANLLEHTPVKRSTTATFEQVLVEYVAILSDPEIDLYTNMYLDELVVEEGELTLPITGFSAESDYFHAMYEIGGRKYYWMYQLGTGVYPQLDAIFNVPPPVAGEFYPFGYFRVNKTSLGADKNSSAYKTSKQMMKLLGLDYDAIMKGVDDNPDIGDVEQAMMMSMVPAITTNQDEQEYLYTFFDRLRLNQDNSSGSYTLERILSGLTRGGFGDVASAIVIQDAAFKLSVSNSGIFKKRLGGSIGKRGAYGSRFAERRGSFPAIDGDNTVYQREYIIPCHYYQYQVSDSMYDEIEVINLTTQYFIFERYSSIGFGNNKLVMVPLDRSIMTEYSIQHSERLFSRSLHYVFNSRIETKLAWYTSDAVVLGLFIIAVVALFFGQAEALTAWLALVAAGSITILQIIIAILTKILIALVIGYAVRKVVDSLGPEAAIAIALIAAAASIYGTFSGLSSEGFGSNICSAPLPFAEHMLTVSSSLVDGVNNAFTGKIKEIQEDYSELTAEAFRVSDVIEKAQDLLATSLLLSPLTIVGEEPDDYYRRTMYSGNVGVAAINGVGNYVERALTLPTIAQTLFGTDVGLDFKPSI